MFKGTPGADSTAGTTAADVINGLAGADTLYGRDGHDTLYGGADNDSLFGEAGNDTLDGGAGNDSHDGGVGNNTYVFGRGDGQDLVNGVYDTTVGRLGTVQFKSDVAPSDVVARRIFDVGYESLELSIAGTSDKITVRNFFSGNTPANVYNPVQQVSFADGTVWDTAAIVGRVAPQSVSEPTSRVTALAWLQGHSEQMRAGLTLDGDVALVGLGFEPPQY